MLREINSDTVAYITSTLIDNRYYFVQDSHNEWEIIKHREGGRLEYPGSEFDFYLLDWAFIFTQPIPMPNNG